MGLVSIGPVTINHGNPSFGSSASPVEHGIRTRQISGSCSWAAANTLDELVANQTPGVRVTKAGRTGVQERLVFDDALLGSWTGDYLLEGFTIDADQKSSLSTTDVPFTLTAAYLGDMA